MIAAVSSSMTPDSRVQRVFRIQQRSLGDLSEQHSPIGGMAGGLYTRGKNLQELQSILGSGGSSVLFVRAVKEQEMAT